MFENELITKSRELSSDSNTYSGRIQGVPGAM